METAARRNYSPISVEIRSFFFFGRAPRMMTDKTALYGRAGRCMSH